jgi:hypothetical protein
MRRKEPKLKRNIATARYGLAASDSMGKQKPSITPLIATQAPFLPAIRNRFSIGLFPSQI